MKNIGIDNISQGEQNDLYKYGYCFSISFYKIIDNVVYYNILFGQTHNGIIDRYHRYVRFSELYDLNLFREYFPSRTLFNHTSESFINNRINQFNTWFNYVYEDKNKCELLYRGLYNMK